MNQFKKRLSLLSDIRRFATAHADYKRLDRVDKITRHTELLILKTIKA